MSKRRSKKAVKSAVKNCNVYVIALDKKVATARATRKSFAAQNPHYVEGAPCVYVGMTSRTPDERFQQHLDGYKSSKAPRKFGLYLRRKLFERLNPMTRADAAKMEVELARKLRDKKGYGVWQN